MYLDARSKWVGEPDYLDVPLTEYLRCPVKAMEGTQIVQSAGGGDSCQRATNFLFTQSLGTSTYQEQELSLAIPILCYSMYSMH